MIMKENGKIIAKKELENMGEQETNKEKVLVYKRLKLVTAEKAGKLGIVATGPTFVSYDIGTHMCESCKDQAIYQVGSEVDDSEHFQEGSGGIYAYPTLSAFIDDQQLGQLNAFVAVMEPFGRRVEQARIYGFEFGPSRPFAYTRLERARVLGIRVFTNYKAGEEGELKEGYFAEATQFAHNKGFLYPLDSSVIRETQGQKVGFRLLYSFKILETGDIAFNPVGRRINI